MLRLALSAHILGALLLAFACVLIVPLGLSLYFNDSQHLAFAYSIVGLFAIGGILLLSTYHWRPHFRMRTKYAFLITVLAWVSICLAGAVPFFLMQGALSPVDAIFEAASGLTTTGASILQHPSHLSPSMLFYRQLLQWIGGMGIIVLAVAILPYLGVGGMQLYHSEIAGPGGSKLTPRITQTAKALWSIYIALTVLCALAYWLGGMSGFDAIAHSFSTVSIGGFSTYDENFAHFADKPALYWIATVFMLLSAVNFGVHFISLRRLSLRPYWQDAEFCFFVLFITIAIVAICALLAVTGTYNWSESWHRPIMQIVSIATTTGFSDVSLATLAPGVAFALFTLAFVGACGGSTGGGIKAIRILLLFKQGHRELKKLLHPYGVFRLRLNRTAVPERITEAVWGFFSVYLIVFITIVALLMLTGMDLLSSWSASGAMLNNLGPGMGAVAQHYGDLLDSQKLILTFTMLLGRLEIFTILVLLMPSSWR